MLFPWDSKKWLQATINSTQIDRLVKNFGFNPINLVALPTSVDTDAYRPTDRKRTLDILTRFQNILSEGAETLKTSALYDFMSSDAAVWFDRQTPLFLGMEKDISCDFTRDNIILLQPTRIITRKNIQRNFELLGNLLKHDPFKEYLKDNKNIKITHHITGPIAMGHHEYFISLLREFQRLLEELPSEFQRRVFLSFTFGMEVNQTSREKNYSPLLIEEIFAVSSLVLLASETEGRGLPIIEASATGVPIISNRYHPVEVFKEVIGEDLDPAERLQIFEFPAPGEKYTTSLLKEITEVLIDPDSHDRVVAHNIKVVKKRFSAEALINTFDDCLHILWRRFKQKNTFKEVIDALSAHRSRTLYNSKFKSLVHSKKRSYLPGYTILEFMIYLKSLIDPSFFRIEEKELKGRTMNFALDLLRVYEKGSTITKKQKIKFFEHIDSLFEYHYGKDPLAIDHSLSYRHRNRIHFPYRKLTEQELYGVIAVILRKVLYLLPELEISEPQTDAHSCNIASLSTNDLKEAFLIYSGQKSFSLDDSDHLAESLASSHPCAIFPEKTITNEVKVFALLPLKLRHDIPVDRILNDDDLSRIKASKEKIIIFARKEPINSPVTFYSILRWLNSSSSGEAGLLYKKGIIEIFETELVASGVHLAQMGAKASKKLIDVKKNNGFILAFGEDALTTTDLLDIPSYRIGTIKSKMASNFMDLAIGDFYIQYVPKGVRPSLSFPTPVQTPLEFSRIMKGELYRECEIKYGNKKLSEIIYRDADAYGTPLKTLLEELITPEKKSSPINSKKINGIHSDGLPWSGALVQLNLKNNPCKFIMIQASRQGDTVLSLMEDYEKTSGKKVSFGWNGGYILNPELVGKLGISEDYIGSPLGLLIVDNRIKALPLFNKATFAVTGSGKIIIRRANLFNGFKMKLPNGLSTAFTGKDRNIDNPVGPSFYDLMYDPAKVPAAGRIILRFVGNRIIEKISGRSSVEILPVGITLSIPENHELSVLKPGDTPDFEIHGWENITDAIEAGPLLVEKGKIKIDMELSGWKKEKSILTQAARLDYTDMRGPKIAIGITGKNEFIVIAVNGRIRESVGATHVDMARILIEQGAVSGMGFDPGGSTTLVADGSQLNVSPYNKDYEKNIYTLPPQPRRVGNAILGIL